MKTSRRITFILLATVVILCFVFVPKVEENLIDLRENHGIEITSMRTIASKTYLLPNGKYEWVGSVMPMHYEKNGALVDLPEGFYQRLFADSENNKVPGGTSDILVNYLSSVWTANREAGGCNAGWVFATLIGAGCGMRFTTVAIPENSTIDTAHLQLTAKVSTADVVVNSVIHGEESDNPGTFATDYASYNSRTRTDTSVNWNNITAWTLDDPYNSPDIADIVQEIIDNVWWDSGDSMVMFWDDHGFNSDAETDHYRSAWSYDGSTSKAPELHITYTTQLPTVTTSSATIIEETTVTLNGNVTDTGGENNDEQGFYYDIDSGTPYANNQTSVGSFGLGTFDEDITGLTKGEKYFFQAISHNNGGWGNGSELTFFTKPDEPTSLTATGVSCGTINLSWSKGTGADNTEIWGQVGSYPTRGVGTLTYNSTETSYSDTNPAGAEDWYYRAWSYASEEGLSQYSDTYDEEHSTSTCNPPILATYNTTEIEETWATLNGSITDVGIENADTRGFRWDIDSGSPYTYNWSQDGDYGIGAYTYNATGLAEGELIYYQATANNSDGWGYGNEITFLTKPRELTVFTNTSASSTTIDFSWTNGNGSQKVLIRYGNASYPTTIIEGTQGFFNTGTTGVVNGLTINTTYYFSAWSYATEGGREQYSDLYVTATVSTISGPLVTTLEVISVEETTATLQGNVTAINDGTITLRGFEWDTDSGIPYTANWTQAGSYGLGVFNHGLTLLTKGDLYHVRTMVTNNNSDWGYGYEVTFLTKPDEPTSIIVSAYTSTSISLQWTKGEGTDTTIIRYSTTGYPADYSSGTLCYNSTGGSTTITPLSSGQIYYFRLWSFATEEGKSQYSDSYDEITDYTLPSDIINLDAYNPSSSAISLSWTKGAGGDTTHIRGKQFGYPADISDGDQVYFGTLGSIVHGGLSANQTWYYIAYAYDSDSGYYSDGYDSDYETTLDTGTPTPTPTPTPSTDDTGTMFIAFIILPLGLMVLGFWQKLVWLYIAAGIACFGLGIFGITEGSTGSALWLVGVLGVSLTLAMTFAAIVLMISKRPVKVSEEDEQANYYRRIQRSIRRKGA